MSPSLLVLTGASGSGKTVISRWIAEHHSSACKVLFFDSIGVPSIEVMEAEYGSGEGWQRAMTLQWIERLLPILSSTAVVFEGQMRIAFIAEALHSTGYVEGVAKIVLVDCDDDTRAARLSIDRAQPELANPTMMNWARYMRDEATTAGIEILDISNRSIEQCASQLLSHFNAESSKKRWR